MTIKPWQYKYSLKEDISLVSLKLTGLRDKFAPSILITKRSDKEIRGCEQMQSGYCQAPGGCAQMLRRCAQTPSGCAQTASECAQTPSKCAQNPSGCAQTPSGCA